VPGPKPETTPAFAIVLADGRSLTISPDRKALEKLKRFWSRYDLQQFEKDCRRAIAYARERKPDSDIKQIVFQSLYIKYANGACGPPLDFKIGDYAIVTIQEKRSNEGPNEGGPAKGSQPIRSETNRTSSAAGFRR